MEGNILIYDVKSGDTLDKIGNAIGMTGDQLMDFHNSQCERMEKLWFNNLAGVKQIIIPKSYKSDEDIWKEKQKQLPPASIMRDFYAKSYFVNETFSGTSGKDVELDYKIAVVLRNKQETNISEEVVEVKCFDFKKNGETPDDKMSSISLACMESIDSIPFTVPFQGSISGIFEFQKLKKRFDKKRFALDDYYIGEIYQKYLDKFRKNLESEDYLLKQFSSTLLYQLLFPKMEWYHKTKNWTEEFYMFQNSFKIKCDMSASYNHDSTEIIETILKGSIRDNISLQEILRGNRFSEISEETVDGEIELNYLTDKKTKKMLQAKVSVIFWNDNELYRKQTLKLTQNEKFS